jgi:ParB family transcriptional regulator, chromosome partitioning protein
MGEKIRKPKIFMVSTHDLSLSSMQPRTKFDDSKIAELAKSIITHGILQPLLVRKNAADKLEIVAGERRFRAAKLSKIKRVPCIMMDLTSKDALAVALVENIQRQDLNPIEEAKAYLKLKETLRLNQEEISSKVGKDRASVANIMRLLKLPQMVQDMLCHESLSMGHARALLSLENSDMISMVAKKIAREGLSVRRVESLIRAIKSGYQTQNFKKLIENTNGKDVLQRAVQEKLQHCLGTRVILKKEGNGYAMVVYFDGAEQLNGLLETLGVEI